MSFRQWLIRLAPTWFASPLRRTIQTGCLAGFLALVFYVCYPYTARPAQVWSGWMPEMVDIASGRVEVAGPESPGGIEVGQIVYARDQGVSPADSLGPFRVTGIAASRLVLEPVGDLPPERSDQIAASFGPWALSEDEPGAWPSHYARDLRAKEIVPAELFLTLDPLVSVTTALAARAWIGALVFSAVILVVCLVVPRGFCGYVCPLGTLIDLFDWALGRRVSRFRVRRDGAWVRLKYYLLAGVLAAAALGVLVSGFVSAIPVATRAVVFLVAPLQTAWARGGHQVPPWHAGHFVSVGLFVLVLGLGFLRPRFWCRHVCPTGAMFSLASMLRVTERRVDGRCIACGRCVRNCPFDAIEADFGTRAMECALCRTCGGVCPTGAIQYGLRFAHASRRAGEGSAAPAETGDRDPPILPETSAGDGPPHGAMAGDSEAPDRVEPVGRRGFLSTAAGAALGVLGGLAGAGAIRVFGATTGTSAAFRPVRPPGSVPEPQFLQMCVRCGECYRACPNDAIQPLGFELGIEGLWTPHLVADWSGCEPSCANCGQVCPTGAIRALPLDEKRAARIGLAVVDTQTCLPYARRGACRLCADECAGAGYHAIEFLRVGTEVDDRGVPIDDSGFLAPVVLADKCVGCGLCQTRCRAINAVEKGLLSETAIRVEAGEGKEDRLFDGSYAALRAKQRSGSKSVSPKPSQDGYLPEFVP
ncbi:MAG: 4Fe-4S binding protein [Thermoguttaceae bacterium]|nr:4Fe-4S binding protein [Thermoguttaceae bacterium]